MTEGKKIKIIIDIDEKDYKFIKSEKSIMKNGDTFKRISADLLKAVKEGYIVHLIPITEEG